MKTINFGHNKNAMINYFNKVKKNPKIKFCFCGLNLQAGGYVVEYCY